MRARRCTKLSRSLGCQSREEGTAVGGVLVATEESPLLEPCDRARDPARSQQPLLAERAHSLPLVGLADEGNEMPLTHVGRWVFAEGLWNVWGGITDHFTHPRGDAAEGCRVATVAATELQDALGEEWRERQYCEEWVKRICG